MLVNSVMYHMPHYAICHRWVLPFQTTLISTVAHPAHPPIMGDYSNDYYYDTS